LKWLGIIPDNLNDILVQSKRLEIYKKHAFELIQNGKAYICTCSQEKLAADREKQQKEHIPTRYEGHCRKAGIKLSDLSECGYVVRLKMPESGKIVVDDLVRGKVEFEAGLMDDQVILKSDGYPTYHLASVIDDHLMQITHVIRSEEWLPSTPKHLVLYEAFGWEKPYFAHLSMILGTDKSKLSKRHGATSVLDYKELGYLPEALVNFMSLLGWNPKNEREFFTLSELVKEFDIKNVNIAPAIFDQLRLDFVNENYLREEISCQSSVVSRQLQEIGLKDIKNEELELLGRGGYKTLKVAAEYLIKLRKMPEYDANLLIFKKSDKGKTLEGLENTERRIQNTANWTSDGLQKALEAIVEDKGLTNGDVFWPVRVALSGEEKSPSPVELLVVLGKEESLARLKKAIEKLQNF